MSKRKKSCDQCSKPGPAPSPLVCLDCAEIQAKGGRFCLPCDLLRMQRKREHTRRHRAKKASQ